MKRLDFSPGEDIPSRRRRGQPKTLAEALMLLALERNRPTQRIYQGGLDCANKGR